MRTVMPDTKPKILYKSFSFDIKETKEMEKNGQKFGIIKGYASTYDTVDRGKERVVKGAFTKSLERHKDSNNRQIRMNYQHNRELLIGGFPIEKAKDDDKGLYVEGEINLDVTEGRSAYSLAKQGVLTDLSIGYSIISDEIKDDIYLLKELELWEISLVSEPMNPEATILEVKKTDIKAEDLEAFETIKDIENFLKEKCGLSNSIRKILISKIKSFSRDAQSDDLDNEQRDACSKLAEQLSDYQINKKLNDINDLLNRGKKNAKRN
jgi:HK97 family phage prohead protease